MRRVMVLLGMAVMLFGCRARKSSDQTTGYQTGSPYTGSVATTTGAHASGILNSPVGHWAVVGEQGPEMMYVPQGASIFPNGSMPGGIMIAPGAITISVPNGNAQTISVGLIDALERELARRFRTTTPGYALGGLG